MHHESTFNLPSGTLILDKARCSFLNNGEYRTWAVKVNETKSTIGIESDSQDLVTMSHSLGFE
jgi:hypothetical protein